MGRQLRIEYPDACYHVTARGNERKVVFKNVRNREKFLSYLESATTRYGAVIHAYCLMNNHYHLLLETPSGNLSQIMQHINGAYTNYFNAKRKRSGHLFQGRYKAILIEADEYALELSRYIHLNPVRVGAGVKPEEYRWSSYSVYIAQEEAPKWLHTASILDRLGTSKSTAQMKYRKFVDELVCREHASPLMGTVAATILGSADFVEEVQARYVDPKSTDRNLPAVRQLSSKPAIDRIIKTAKETFGDKARLAGKAAIFLCHRYSGAKLREIGKCFGVKDSAVSQSSRRFMMALTKDKELQKTVTALVKRLGL